ncbi:MAG: hybrid sensor histidine kinase/response regulator [Phycisphaerales bacterium]|nr:hybrid sensor histidine kinase/response regulator [Phycisphaerales bacterium]
MSDTSPFGGVSLLDLFKLEAESHCAALSDGLLALEKSPDDSSPVEALMRAAHSVKGAARIVGLDVVVPLAHAMEECFLAAKSGKERITSARIDQLLACVDVLAGLRTLAEPDLPEWIAAHTERISALVTALKSPAPAATSPPPPAAPAELTVQDAATAPSPPPQQPPPPPTPPPTPHSTPHGPPQAASHSPSASAAQGAVRVAATVLNRMLFLAGESTVEATRLQSLRGPLSEFKTRERALESAVRAMGEALAEGQHANGRQSDAARDAFEQLLIATNALRTSRVEQTARLEDAFRRMEELSGALHAEVVRSRLRPFSEGTGGFARMTRDLARELGKEVTLRIEGESVQVDRDILQRLDAPLTHLIRNGLDHGIEIPSDRIAARKPAAATIHLIARHQSGMLAIEVRDDGRGIDPEAVRAKVVERRLVDAATAQRLTRDELLEMLFLPGFSTRQTVSEISGRGVGLNVVQSMAQEVGGTVTLESELGRGSRFTLRLPVTRSVVRAAIVRIGAEFYALPLAKLERIVVIEKRFAPPVQGRSQFDLDGSSIGLVRASEILALDIKAADSEMLSVLVIGAGHDRCGLVVDEVCEEEDLVIRPLDARLGQVPHISAAAIRSDGTPMLVVDVDDLRRSVRQSLEGGRPLGVSRAFDVQDHTRARVLVVDDSITVREVERQLLSRHGYDVDVAVDGKDGLNMLRTRRYDLLVTDVDMPRMTGIELTRAVRNDPKLASLPIVIVSYKDREEDRLAGLEAGANAYLTKGSFQDDSLIRMVRDLIGAAG